MLVDHYATCGVSFLKPRVKILRIRRFKCYGEYLIWKQKKNGIKMKRKVTDPALTLLNICNKKVMDKRKKGCVDYSFPEVWQESALMAMRKYAKRKLDKFKRDHWNQLNRGNSPFDSINY